MTGIQTLFGVVKDQQVSGGIMSILQDCICEVVLSEMSYEYGPDSHWSRSCVSYTFQFQYTCAWWNACVQSEAQKNMVYEH
jgi:hypothetical protein